MPFQYLVLTGEQIRAARALTRINQAELAEACGLSLETIKRLERIRGAIDANIRTIKAIIQTFEAMGIKFDSWEGGGVGVSRPLHGGPSGVRQPPQLRSSETPDHTAADDDGFADGRSASLHG
jgi:transcriptional regulator with XRE-family HTH domain